MKIAYLAGTHSEKKPSTKEKLRKKQIEFFSELKDDDRKKAKLILERLLTKEEYKFYLNDYRT